MIAALSSIFSRYEALVAEADALFTHVRDAHADCVTCHQGCSDCCHALFDLSLIEAMYLNEAFGNAFGYGKERSDILLAAADIDRQTARIKRELYRATKDGTGPEDIMRQAAAVRIRCPLLDTQDKCLMYDKRPITCRLYGIPTAIGGQGHVCGKTRFAKGGAYPTVNLDKIQNRMAALSQDIATTLKSRFTELHQVYVPVSMALVTKYTDSYLGIGPAKKED